MRTDHWFQGQYNSGVQQLSTKDENVMLLERMLSLVEHMIAELKIARGALSAALDAERQGKRRVYLLHASKAYKSLESFRNLFGNYKKGGSK